MTSEGHRQSYKKIISYRNGAMLVTLLLQFLCICVEVKISADRALICPSVTAEVLLLHKFVYPKTSCG